jgi:transcriptional regulator with XRE-family HTH domain
MVAKIFELLCQRGISQKKLADHLGISASVLSDWKSGRLEPSALSFAKIAKYFNVTSDYLLGLSDSPEVAAPQGDVINITEKRSSEMEHGRLPMQEAAILIALSDKTAPVKVQGIFRNLPLLPRIDDDITQGINQTSDEIVSLKHLHELGYIENKSGFSSLNPIVTEHSFCITVLGLQALQHHKEHFEIEDMLLRFFRALNNEEKQDFYRISKFNWENRHKAPKAQVM